MATTFDSAGDATEYFYLQPGDSVTWELEPDTDFIGTIFFEKTLDGNTRTIIFSIIGTAGTPYTANGTGAYKNESKIPERVRFRCDAIDDLSDDIDVTITNVDEVYLKAHLENGVIQGTDGSALLTVRENSIDIPSLNIETLSVSGPISGDATTLRSIILNTTAKVGGTAGWVVGAADNLGVLATLPAGQTASTLVIPVTGFGVDDIITRFYLLGQIESAGNACTVDCELRKLTAVAADNTDVLVQAITQVSVIADTALNNVTSDVNLGDPEIVVPGVTYYLLITATTAAATDISLLGAVVNYTQAINSVE